MKILPPILKLLLLMGLPCVGSSFATGYYGPNEYLGGGGARILATPEFYWELEVKRLAQEFHPTEKLSKTQISLGSYDTPTDITPLKEVTVSADLSDFNDALKNKAINPTDPLLAAKEHEAARKIISQTTDKSTNALSAEWDSEFADYHRGAYAYAQGKGHWEEAKKAWEALLERPAEQRHYRSVWAAFMLGKLAMKNNDPSAVKWFQKTRDLAKQGFADSLGMAADSYGWEGRSEWKQGHPENAAPLYLTQLSLGDESAIVSLKALIPDRVPVDGMLNYGPEDDVCRSRNLEQRKAADDKALAELKISASDPLLRKLITAHILCAGDMAVYYADSANRASNRALRWLTVIEEAHIKAVEDAEYLGWLAYSSGDYKNAERWLKLAKSDSPAACWLSAKLQLREGNLTEALRSMSQAFQSLKSLYPGDCKQDGAWSFHESASGDLAQLQLTRGDFIQSFDIFFKGGLWDDAAFVAERVLTTDELKAYVDQQNPALVANKDISCVEPGNLRGLLGRRLVRDGRYAEAAKYLPAPYDKVLAKYVEALRKGADGNLSKNERALAYFSAAGLARYHGMELMGTEVAPDSFYYDGEFENTDIAQQRLSGKYVQTSYEDGKETNRTLSMMPEPSKQERLRLQKNQINPDVRFHYRVIAVNLALKAAKLLNNNTVELADVLNTAGNWIKNRDEKLGNHLENLLENRCSETEIGKAAIAKHWFVETLGPWSQSQKDSLDSLHKELNIQSQN